MPQTRDDDVGHYQGTPCVDKWEGAITLGAVAFPLNGQARSFRRAFGWIALIDVITFKKDFRPSGFDRPVTEFFKNQIVSKLAGAGIVRLTVLLKRGPARQLVLHFDGAPEDVAKANEAFDLEFSQRSRAERPPY